MLKKECCGKIIRCRIVKYQYNPLTSLWYSYETYYSVGLIAWNAGKVVHNKSR